MLGIELVQALEDDWRETLDAIARTRGWPQNADVQKLAACVADVSAAYNDSSRARAGSARGDGAARLGFFFARDVPKGAAAVRELVATGVLRLDGVLRVLDVGAGLGATTWGLVRALEASGARGVVEATWVDSDEDALAIGSQIVRARGSRAGAVELRVRSDARSLRASRDRHDVVLLGHVLSELDVGDADDARVDAHATLLANLIADRLEDRGALVVVEPALRDRTRHLHRVRDAVLARGAAGVFAPCLHGAPCPALARANDWCHEDLRVDLPAWLVPVARAAGLRHEGLGFAYVVLRKDGVRLVDRMPAAPARLRVVSDRMETKGKSEAFLCGDFAGTPARARVTRLDRDAAAGNADWDTLARGSLAAIDPAPELGRPRVRATSAVRVLRSGDAETR